MNVLHELHSAWERADARLHHLAHRHSAHLEHLSEQHQARVSAMAAEMAMHSWATPPRTRPRPGRRTRRTAPT